MTKPLSNDLRSRAIEAVAGGMSCGTRPIASVWPHRRCGVGASMARHGHLGPAPTGRRQVLGAYRGLWRRNVRTWPGSDAPGLPLSLIWMRGASSSSMRRAHRPK